MSRVALLFAASLMACAADFDQLTANNHWKRARDLAEEFFYAHPNDARAAYQISVVRKVFGAREEAQKYAETAVRLDPKNGEYHRNLADIYGDLANKAGAFKSFGLARKCHAELEAAAALDPSHIENLEAFMIYSIEAPSIVGGDKKKAAELAEQIGKLDRSRGYLDQARIARAVKQDGALRGLYERAVEANPNNYPAQVLLANYYLGAKEYALSENHARKALELNPDNANGYKLLAAALVHQKRTGEAEAIAARAESAIPDNLSPHLWIGRALLGDGNDLDKAEFHMKKYLAQPPEPVESTLAMAHFWIGQLYEKLGRKNDARSALESALRLQPDFDAARRELKRLN